MSEPKARGASKSVKTGIKKPQPVQTTKNGSKQTVPKVATLSKRPQKAVDGVVENTKVPLESTAVSADKTDTAGLEKSVAAKPQKAAARGRGGAARRPRGNAAFIRLYSQASSRREDTASSVESTASTASSAVSVDAETGKCRVAGRLLDRARTTGVLNLSNLNLSEIPEQVYNINERPDDSADVDIRIGGLCDAGELAQRSDDLALKAADKPSLPWWEWSPLNTLQMVNNRITAVGKHIGRLKALRTLDLSHNSIEALPEAIGECEMLEKIILNYNSLTALPNNISKLYHLRVLLVSNNKLKIIPPLLSDLKHIEHADLSNNEISAFPRSALSTWRVSKLNLSHNRIGPLKSGEFCWLQGIVDLDLSYNDISELSDDVGDCARMERIDVSCNKLNALPELQYCSALQILTCADNRIKELPANFFALLPSLKECDLRDNHLEVLPTSILQCRTLERLMLDRNSLAGVPAELSLLPALKYLSLADNPVRTLKRDAVQRGGPGLLSYLREKLGDDQLLAAGVKLDEKMDGLQVVGGVRAVAFDAIRARRLDLTSHKLDTLSDELMDELKEKEIICIDLTDNNFTEIPERLWQFSSCLNRLVISKNRLTVCPGEISHFVRLTTLGLSVNSLCELPDELANCNSLNELDISYNRFTSVPAVVYKLSNLLVLNMSGNKVTSIAVADALDRLEHLSTLDLSSNDIRVVPPELGLMECIRCLKLEGNSFRVPRAATLARGTEEIMTYLRNSLPQRGDNDAQ